MTIVESLLEAYAIGHPADAAQVFEAARDGDETSDLWDRLSTEARAAVVPHLGHPAAARLLSRISVEEAARALAPLAGDAAAPVIRAMAPEHRTAVLAEMGAGAVPLRRLLAYADRTAGALMDPLVPAYARDLTAAEALERVRRSGAQATSYLYVVDPDGQLLGVLSLRELLHADPGKPLHAIMTPRPVALVATASWETVLAHPGWERAHALPVVDRGRYVGALRYRTLRALERAPRAVDAREELANTTRELAQLYALGWASLLAWGSSVIDPKLRPGEETS